MYSTNQKDNARVKVCIGVYCSKISTHSTCMVACTTDKTEIWLSPSAKQCWNPCSGSPPVHLTIWVHTMIGLLKKPLSICQSGWKGNWNTLLVICWVCRRPRTRILVLLSRHYQPRLNYFCNTGFFYGLRLKCIANHVGKWVVEPIV